MLNPFENESHHQSALHFRQDSITGLRAIIAITNPSRGPGLGGCRLAHYPSIEKATQEAADLAACMLYKSTLHDLPFCGAKAVLMAPNGVIPDRRAYFQAFGDFVESLNGQYITAVDSGVNESDMNSIAKNTGFVTNHSNVGGNPATDTALGVVLGIEAAIQFNWQAVNSLEGVHVLVQGIGQVGMALVHLLKSRGAKITVSDLNEDLMQHCQRTYKTGKVSPFEVFDVPCDVFAPCATTTGFDVKTLTGIHTKIIAGATNNPLPQPSLLASLLHARGILYVPDFVINAGGLIRCAAQYLGARAINPTARIQHIPALTRKVLQLSRTQQIPPLDAAKQLANMSLLPNAAFTL